ncbi:aspartate kinase [Kangiella spongicola]|uniref:Aspartokinase n=1 Tax=Kangiella spongicola TaxID=796379 RepID=A0A318D4W7_9GAMM|nr:aspartate kinase [Kangiella spongicola]PXF63883.1 aspartate kinase [Kangiella spongicola]
MTKDSQSPSWVVLKFGGSSVSSRDDWNNIVEIIRSKLQQGLKVAVVHSAFKNVTNRLEKLAQLAASNAHHELLDELVEYHQAMAEQLKLESSLLAPWLESLTDSASEIVEKGGLSSALRAKVVAHGELLSSALGAAFLEQQLADDNKKTKWLDARDLFISEVEAHSNINDRYLNAVCHPRPDLELSEQWSQNFDVVLTQGFIASNDSGETVLLGREGSDTSASYLAALLEAKKLEVWTDVAGMFTTDPNKIADAKKLEQVSYAQAFEMAEAGAKVLHPRCLSTVMPYHIPIEIKNTHQPLETGTLINGEEQNSRWVKAIAIKQQVPVMTLLLGRRGQQPKTLQKVFAIFNEMALGCELLASTKESLVIAVETSNSVHDKHILNDLSVKLAEMCRSVLLSHSAIITLVGCPSSQALWHLLQIDAELPEQWLLLSQTSSDQHLSFLVSDDEAIDIVKLLHKHLIQ